MRLLGLALATVLLLGPSSVVGAAQGSSYYKLYERTFTILDNRFLEVYDKFTLVNSSSFTSITSVSWAIPTVNINDVRAWDGEGNLVTSTSIVDSSTRIVITFRGQGLLPGSKLTFYLSYTAGGMVQGTGVEYRAGLGGITAGDFRYDNYTVRIRGPAGSYPFLHDPQAELVENDPPMLVYSTSIQENEDFNGLRVRFYKQPAFYRLTLEYLITNNGTSPTTDLRLDAILFNSDVTWQFSSLVSSSIPIETMYVDEENNWHGVFKVDELATGESKTITLELLYEVMVYDPDMSAQDVGTISEVPASFKNYLKPDEKWESGTAIIQQAASDAVADQTNVYLAAKQISEFVVDRIDYEIQPKRQGALWAFENESGDCSEYTDLSIALARAAGIPARATYGWGYYEEENLRGHAWLEYYFPNKGWQPADPTWSETAGDYFSRLDPIHLTRNVKGLTSGEHGATITYYGSGPTFDENSDIGVLNSSSAAQEYIAAARYAVEVAEKLLSNVPDDALQAKLEQARQALSQAQAAEGENEVIFYAKNSLQNSGEVISVLGQAPSAIGISVDYGKIFTMVIIVGGISVIALVIYAILHGRKRKFYPY